MNVKHKAKRGFSLIEILISVTILVILIIPLSSMILSSMKKNRQAEKVQEATAEGQSYIEEFGALDDLKFTTSGSYYEFSTLDGKKFKFDKNIDPSTLVIKYKSKITTINKFKYIVKINRQTTGLYKKEDYVSESDCKNYYATIEFSDSSIIVRDCNGKEMYKNDVYSGKRLDVWLDVSSADNAITSMILSDFVGDESKNDDTSNSLYNSVTATNKLSEPTDNNAKRKIKIVVDKNFKQSTDLPVKIHCYGSLNLSNEEKKDDNVVKDITVDIYSDKSTKNTILPSCLYQVIPNSIDKNGTKNYNTEVKISQNKISENKKVPGDLCTMRIYAYDKDTKDNDIENGAKPLFKGSITSNINIING